jgi:hypothetical protein
MNDQTPPITPDNSINADDVTRIIMLIYGKLEDGNPFWCYVAVKPSQFEAFKAAEAAGTINLYEFAPYGEVIVSAPGQTPPAEVTRQVAEMYGADPSTFFQPIDPLAAVDEKLKEWQENPPKN